MEGEYCFSIFLDGKFFKFIPKKSSLGSKKVVFVCIKYLPNKIVVKNSLTMSSYFNTKRSFGYSSKQ